MGQWWFWEIREFLLDALNNAAMGGVDLPDCGRLFLEETRRRRQLQAGSDIGDRLFKQFERPGQ